mgnify:FL=1
MIYGVTDKNTELTEVKEVKVLLIYQKLIVLALRK